MNENVNPPAPPPPPGSGGPPPAPPAGPSTGPMVRIGDWFNTAWETVKPAWLEYVIAFLAYQVVLLVASALCFLPGIIIFGPLLGGLYVYAAKRMEGMDVEITDIFKGFQRFVDLMIVGLVIALVPGVVAMILWLPAILAMLGAGATTGTAQEGLAAAGGLTGCLGCVIVPIFLFVYPILANTFFIFAYPLILFRNMSAIDALKESFEIVKPKFLNFLALLAACIVILVVASFVGGLLLVVGSLILVPLAWSIAITMQLLAYREFVGLTAEDLAPYR